MKRTFAAGVVLLAVGALAAFAAIAYRSPGPPTDPTPPSSGENSSDPRTPVTRSLQKAQMLSFERLTDPASPEGLFVGERYPKAANPMQYVSLAEADLNADGRPEEFYYVAGSATCGTGNCELEVLEQGATDVRSLLTVSTGPVIYVLAHSTRGFRDLALPGRVDADTEWFRIWRWTGAEYRPEDEINAQEL